MVVVAHWPHRGCNVRRVGRCGVTALSKDNYVVASPYWDNGAASDVGAATFGSGVSGISGVVSASKSLVGSNADDLGGNRITALSNGHNVVLSPEWDNGVDTKAGAITLALADGNVTGTLTSTHSVLGLVAGGGETQVFG